MDAEAIDHYATYAILSAGAGVVEGFALLSARNTLIYSLNITGRGSVCVPRTTIAISCRFLVPWLRKLLLPAGR